MVLRAGSEFPLNTGPWEEAWQKAASSDRMGWGVEWAHLRHPSRCKPHSCISARCSAGRRNTHTHTKELSLPSSGKMTVQIFMKYLGGLSQPCMDTCKLLPSWIGKCVFPLEFPSKWAIPATLSMRSRQKWTGSMLADTGLCPNCGTWEPFRVPQSNSVFHPPPDSVQTRLQMLSLTFCLLQSPQGRNTGIQTKKKFACHHSTRLNL